MTSPVRSIRQIPDTVADVVALREHVNRVLRALQEGSLLLGGLRLDTQLATVPTAAPGIGEPNLVPVNVAGTLTVYWWDGAAWVVLGTQV